MNWDAIGAVGELIGSVAVLVTLAYLAVQVRQTERNQRAILNQGAIHSAAEAIQWIAQADMSGLYTRVIEGDRTFSAQEVLQLRALLRGMLVGLQDQYVQRKAALLDEITLENAANASKVMLAQSVFRVLWRTNQHTYAQEFAAYVDQLIEGTPLVGPVDMVAQLNAGLAELEGTEPS